jgi:effector-binding domain-containing protein
MENSFGQLMAMGGEFMAGPPFAIWYEYEGDTFVFDNCIPVSKTLPGSGEIRSIMSYGGKVVKVTHTGSYESTQYSWEALEKYISENSLQTNGDPYEVYTTDPGQEPDPARWITELYWPVK